MAKDNRIGFIGGGNMAEAILSSVIGRGLVKAGNVLISDPLEDRRTYLNNTYGVETLKQNLPVVESVEVLILAVKPQQLNNVMIDLKGHLTIDQVVLSIIAGIKIDNLRIGLDHNPIISVMPNTPAQVGEGMSVWTASDGVSEKHKMFTQNILETLGLEIFVEDEKYIDMATALSASGPAYLFLFIEAMIDAGVHIGLTREMSQKLVVQTVLGSAVLAKDTSKHPAELRNMVTSPGGTTAEAVLMLEKEGFRSAIINAVIAAYRKAVLLGEV